MHPDREHPDASPGRLLIVGAGPVSDALGALATTLDWPTETVDTLADAEAAIGTLTGDDAVVVLSHHDGVDGPALAAALAGAAGYVGAMGSRRTQQRRADWLAGHGVSAEQQQAIRGPAGLDIGADTPAEIALSIAAEIVAVRRGVSGTASISSRGGPIHPDLAPGEATCPGG